ncbi:MAG: hypothetical protein FWE68_06085, partial [Defluviitaleaceae bacterium]|nr:hypothetical protein [Defluviitaleaceae bacterium]
FGLLVAFSIPLDTNKTVDSITLPNYCASDDNCAFVSAITMVTPEEQPEGQDEELYINSDNELMSYAEITETAAGLTGAVYIASQEAFDEWINANPDGGSIELGANIIVRRHFANPVTIETGAFGVTLDGGLFFNLNISGEGVDQPVLTVVNPGVFMPGFSPAVWDNFIPVYNIEARGREGEGGTALYISRNLNSSPGFSNYRGQIISKGADAVGVRFNYPIKAHFLTVSVEGTNSRAIDAPNGTQLYYCILEASGDGAKVVSGDIFLYMCNIKGEISGANAFNRKITASTENFYLPLSLGQNKWASTRFHDLERAGLHTFLLSGDEHHPAKTMQLTLEWDNAVLNSIDTSVLGITVVPGKLLDELYGGLGLEDKDVLPFELVIEVIEPDVPRIISTRFRANHAHDNHRRSAFFRTDDGVGGNQGFNLNPDRDPVTFWLSKDMGLTWDDITESADVSLEHLGVRFLYDELTGPHWFYVEANGKTSNIATIFDYGRNSYLGIEGIRKGLNGDGANNLPGPTNPTPRPNPRPTPTASSTPTLTPTPTALPTPPMPTPASAYAPIPAHDAALTPTPTPVSGLVPTPSPIPISDPAPVPIGEQLSGSEEPQSTTDAVQIPMQAPVTEATAPVDNESHTGGTIHIPVAADMTSVTIDATAAQTFADAAVSVVVSLPAAEITIPPEALAILARAGGPITIEAFAVGRYALNDKQAAQINGHGLIISIDVFAGGVKLDVPLTVSIPYIHDPGEDPADVHVWHLDDNGVLTKQTSAYDAAAGIITLSINHQSFFVIGYASALLFESYTSEPQSSPRSSPLPIIGFTLLGVGIAVGAAAAILKFSGRKQKT